MSKPSIDKLFGLLIMAGWSKTQILRVINEVYNIHPEDLNNLIDDASNAASELHYRASHRMSNNRRLTANPDLYMSMESLAGLESYERYDSHDAMNTPMLTEIYEKIHDYLVIDLNLSTHEIVDLISSEIYKINKSYIPPLSKKSLKNWIARLLSYYPPGEILHAVANIRNRHTGSKNLDWSLRNE